MIVILIYTTIYLKILWTKRRKNTLYNEEENSMNYFIILCVLFFLWINDNLLLYIFYRKNRKRNESFLIPGKIIALLILDYTIPVGIFVVLCAQIGLINI